MLCYVTPKEHLGHLNNIRSGETVYDDKAIEKVKYFIGAMAQRVFREMTELERERFIDLQRLP